MTEGIYRIYVIGEIPPDLKDRIAALHALGILKGKAGVSPATSHLGKPLYRSLPSCDNIEKEKPNQLNRRSRSRG